MAAMTGGCMCGAVRYEARGEPVYSIVCYCRQCQQISGAGQAPQFAVEKSALTLEGELGCYEMTADSGNTVTSMFCPTCGAPIAKQGEKMPELMFFHAATLDNPDQFSPKVAVYLDRKPAWVAVDPEIKRVE